MSRVHVGLISDTHAPRFWKAMPARVAEELAGVDLILHAGDVCLPRVLDELASLAPVRAVAGNNDGPEVETWGATPTLELELAGVRVAMIHDAGAKQRRLNRMHRRFPDADVVVFGHSHIPLHESDERLTIVNPGSPTDKRRQPQGTVGHLVLADGAVESIQIVPVT